MNRRTVSPRCCLLACVATLALGQSGCLVFEKQTGYFVFPAGKDHIQALFVYENLAVGSEMKDKKDTGLDKAKADLVDLVEGKAFYLGSPLLRSSLKEVPKDPQGKLAFEHFNKHVTIRKGFFLQGGEGRFSYCQPIVINDAKAFFAGWNPLIGGNVAKMTEQALAAKELPANFDRKTLLLWQKAAKTSHAWLTYQPGRLAVAWPGSPQFFAKVKHEMLTQSMSQYRKRIAELAKEDNAETRKNLWQALEKDMAGFDRLLDMLAQTPWSVDHRPESLTLAIGLGAGEPLRIDAAIGDPLPPPGPLGAQLFEFSQTLKVPLRQNVTLDQVLDEFRKEHMGK